MTTPRPPRATLYTFPGSVWASVPRLVALEKSYTEDELDEKTVNLGKGENFSPAFLKLSPNGHVPVLVVPYEHTLDDTIPTKFRALCGTKDICDFLDASSTRSTSHHSPALSPATVQRSADSKEVIEHVHRDDAPDPNKILLSFRNDDERDAKYHGMVGAFLKGRQDALERYSKEVGEGETKLKAFYEQKLAENGGLLSMYEGRSDASEWIKASNAMWAAVPKTLALFESKLEDTAPYLLGDQISLADLHAGAWFIRILAAAGTTSIPSSPEEVSKALKQLESNFGPEADKVGPKTERWIENLFSRASFKKVYGEGCH
ncbi:hypothetical protein JCM10212_006346 [Sporobolomyces blumeae]